MVAASKKVPLGWKAKVPLWCGGTSATDVAFCHSPHLCVASSLFCRHKSTAAELNPQGGRAR